MGFFSNLGFNHRDKYELLQMILHVQEHGEVIKTNHGEYLNWSIDERMKVWMKVEDNKPTNYVYPFFAGETRMRVVLLEKARRSRQAISEGAFLCRNRPYAGRNWIAGQLPFVFDIPDYDRYDHLQLPRLAEVQITASAFELKGYETEDDYLDANPPDENGYYYQAEHFIPLAAIKPLDEDNEMQSAGGEVSGFVLDTAIITNPVTESDFCWARLKTRGGEMDVVCSPSVLDGYLVAGGVAVVNAYLFGRVLEDTSH